MSQHADLRHLRREKADAVNKLLHQRCTCSYKVCFEQFQGRESEVIDARRLFQEAPAFRKDPQVDVGF